jgi:hypothetical protein
MMRAFCNYLGIIFVLLTYENVWQFMKNMNFVPPIMMALLYIGVVQYKKFMRKQRPPKEVETDKGGNDKKQQ